MFHQAAKAVLVTLVMAGAAPARAANDDEQVWTSIIAVEGLTKEVDATLELHSRYTDDVSRVGQVLIRPSLTYKLPHGWLIAGGYAYIRTRLEGTRVNDEHRSWQQVGYIFAANPATGLLIGGRTRVEQRFRPDANGVGWRLRQQVRAQLPVRAGSPVRAVVWNETFIGLNTTQWDRHSGVDQVRTFAGASLPVAKGITVEPGYLNQTIFRVGPDRVNHILATNVIARF